MKCPLQTEAFKLAHNLIANKPDEFYYICLTLEHLQQHNYITEDTATECTQIISNLLDGSLSYNGWLRRRHPNIYNLGCTYNEVFRNARLQWLNYLITTNDI